MNIAVTRRRALIRSGALLSTGLLGTSVGAAATAQAYPSKLVELVVPFSAGGPTDALGRLAATGLAAELGQPFVALNKPGAGGMIGTEFVARSAPDGHTLLLGGLTLAVAPFLYGRSELDLFRSFTPISQLSSIGYVLVVHPEVPANSVKELIEYLRANPGKVNYASPGSGTTPHLAAELFKRVARVEMTGVSYKGGAPAMNDLLAGHVQVYFDVIGSSKPMIETGRLKALATSGLQRSQLLPNLPTIAESGLPGFDVTAWNALFAHKDTPKEIVMKLSDALRRVNGSSSFQTGLRTLGMERAERTGVEFETFVRAEMRRWQEVIVGANIRP